MEASKPDIKEQLKDVEQLNDLVEVSIVATYFVQKLGKASHADVLAKMQEIHADVNPYLLDQALEALRGRGILSYATGKKISGETAKFYRMRQVIWAAPPEIAHIKDLLPALVSTDEATHLIAILNDSEENGAGEKKSKSKLGYCDYTQVRVHFITMTELLGSQPDSPHLRKIVTKANEGRTSIDADLRFWRDAEGSIVIPSDNFRGWLRTAMRTRNAPEAAVSYLGISDAKVKPKRALTQSAMPVVDPRTRQGKGLNTHETLQAGEHLSVTFRIPKRGFMDAESFVAWLSCYAPNPTRGMSPARGGRFGKLAVIGYDILGDMMEPTSALGAVIDSVPEEAQQFYKDLMHRAKDGKFSFKPGSGEVLLESD